MRHGRSLATVPNQLSFPFLNLLSGHTQNTKHGTGEISIDGWDWSCLAAAFLVGHRVSRGNKQYPLYQRNLLSRDIVAEWLEQQIHRHDTGGKKSGSRLTVRHCRIGLESNELPRLVPGSGVQYKSYNYITFKAAIGYDGYRRNILLWSISDFFQQDMRACSYDISTYGVFFSL